MGYIVPTMEMLKICAESENLVRQVTDPIALQWIPSR
ncbi:hypothetical protein A2U01_0106304, partial [Trifolium medium]|nr:hypothetical protein [Trifolium medium]